MKTLMIRFLTMAALCYMTLGTNIASAFYDPSVQRWVNRDPLEEEGGFNLYGMVFNDPVNAYDAFGLQGNEGKPKPPKWNPDEWQKNRENCCAYAYDRPGRTLQPGE